MTQRITIVTLCHICDTPGNPSIDILIQYFFEIYIDGVRKWRQENNNPRTFSDVKVWASRGDHGFPPADAYIKHLEYENLVSGSGSSSGLLLMLLQSLHSTFHFVHLYSGDR